MKNFFECKENLRYQKGVCFMQCLKCKKDIDNDSVYCKYCGKKQIKTEKAKELKKPNGYGSVIKLSGRRRKPWAVRVTDSIIDGKQNYRYISYYETKTEAIQALAQEQICPTSPKAALTLSELFEEWKMTNAYIELSKFTKSNYNNGFTHLEPLHNKKFNDLRTSSYEKVINNACKVDKNNNRIPLSFSSKEKIKILLGLLYKYAMENDICNKNYAQFIRIPKQEKTEKEIFNKKEIDILFENDNIENVDTILILLYTGLRINEMLNLKKTDINLENNTITGGLKTDAGKNRIIPIHPKIKKYIYNRYNNSSKWIFCRDQDIRLTDGYYRTHIFYPLLERLNIKKKMIHSTRHTTATLLAESGADINAIKQILGHSNYAFTADTYTHVDINFLQNELEKI